MLFDKDISSSPYKEINNAVVLATQCESVEYSALIAGYKALLWCNKNGRYVLGKGNTAWAAVKDAHEQAKGLSQ